MKPPTNDDQKSVMTIDERASLFLVKGNEDVIGCFFSKSPFVPLFKICKDLPVLDFPTEFKFVLQNM